MSAGTILVAEDDAGIRTILVRALRSAGHEVVPLTTVRELDSAVRRGEGDLVITDVVLPDGSGLDALARIKRARSDLPIVVMSAQNTFMTAVSAAERGAYEYLPKPFDIDELIGIVARALASPRRVAAEEQPDAEDMPLVGRSPAMQDVYRTLARVMQTDLTVLVTGESGTGKELVARALHDYGRRRNRAFVAVNVAAIPRDLIEAELFGHEKGAFTGADTRGSGRFERAEGGTLFLDEIGDMPMEAQTRLLRVLQEREYTSVGGKRPRATDVRIVAATNQNLQSAIDAGRFREDLFYRINVVPLRLPALRERSKDIGELTAHFLAKCAADGLPKRTMSSEALDVLQSYHWPGNVRELENTVQRLTVMSNDAVISRELAERVFEQAADTSGNSDPLDLDATVRSLTEAALHAGVHEGTLHAHMLARLEKPLIETVLASAGGNQLRAAAILGVNRNTLRKRIRDLGVAVSRGATGIR